MTIEEIGPGGFGSGGWFLIILSVVFALVTSLCVLRDYINRHIEEKGREIRRSGSYSMDVPNEPKKLIKESDWKYQINRGKTPKRYRKKIVYTNHLSVKECFVSEKGL